MSSLDNVINKIDSIDVEGDIDMAIEYCEMLNEPLLSYEQYIQLKEHLDNHHTQNNRLLDLNIRTRTVAAYEASKQYRLISEQLSNVQEEYYDDFI